MKFKRGLIALLAVCSAGVATADVQIREGYVREMPPGQSTSAAFMDIVNNGNRPVAIVAATSDAAQIAEVHAHSHENGMMRMEQVKRLLVPANGHTQLAPGGYHLMLINLKRSLHAGENVGIILIDEEGKTYSAQLPVVKMVGVAP